MLDRSQAAGGRRQVRLWDLVVIVIGAAIVFDVTRRSMGAWPGGVWPGVTHAPGLVVLTLGVALGFIVAIQGIRRFRAREVGAWGAAWRLLALAWLTWSVLIMASALEVRPVDSGRTNFLDFELIGLRLFPLMMAFGLIGLILASSPVRPPVRASGVRPRLGSWPSVFLAGLAGLAILVGNGLIPYLVLISVNMVWYAMTRMPMVARPSMHDRLVMSALEGLPGLLGCLATAAWIDDELRAAVGDPVAARIPRSIPGIFARLATVGLAVGGVAYVWLVSFPRLNPWLVEAALRFIDSSIMPMVVLGFAMLAAGLAARSAAHLAIGPREGMASPRRPFGPWPRRIVGGLACLVALDVIVSAVRSLGWHENDYYVPLGLFDWSQIILAPLGWLGYSGPSTGWDAVIDSPGELLFIAAVAWIAIRLVLWLRSKGDGGPSPLDAIAADRLAIGRFFGWWIGLTIAILASLPLMGLAALALTQSAIDWLAN